MEFSSEDFFSKYDEIRSFLWHWPHIQKNSLMEYFIFCAVNFLESSGQNLWNQSVFTTLMAT